MVIDHAVWREEPLSLLSRREALDLRLPPPCGLMRVLRSVVQIPAAPMSDLGREFAPGHAVARQPISDQQARLVSKVCEQAPGEPLGWTSVSPIVHVDIQHHAVLVYHAPEL